MPIDPTRVTVACEQNSPVWRVNPWIALSLLAPAVGAGTVLLTFHHLLPLSPNEEIYVSAIGMLLAVLVGAGVIGYCWTKPKTSWIWIVVVTHAIAVVIGAVFVVVFLLVLSGIIDAAA
ncbi:hypothetical protein BH10PLA1_BH10PLA1_11010 [soil metagenome]